MARRPPGNRWLLVLGGSLLALAAGPAPRGPALGGPAPPEALPVGRTPPPDATFAAVAGAWTRRDDEGVVAHADPDPKGALVLSLLSDPPISGTYLKAQARQTLKAYFERIRGNPRLQDVTTAESKRAAPGTRLYDYTYRPEGRDPVTTRLEVALKQVSGAWILASIGERPRPRASAIVPRSR
jgi:hypothetical protein